MRDGVIKHDGTSRLIKANLPATYEELRAMAKSATLPVDVLFNAAGWDILPTFLNKENLLKDATAALFGLGADAVPDHVFSAIHGDQSDILAFAGKLASDTSGVGATVDATSVSGGSGNRDCTGEIVFPQIPEGQVMVFINSLSVTYDGSGGGSGAYTTYNTKGELVVNGVAYTVFEQFVPSATGSHGVSRSLMESLNLNVASAVGRPLTSADTVKFVLTNTVVTAGGYNMTETWNSGTITARYV